MAVIGARHQDASAPQNVDVLFIEDSAADIELAVRRLQHGGFRCRYRVAESEHALRRALRERLPDFILSDFTLPEFDGFTALSIAREAAPDVPFLFLSGTLGEERAIEALRRGAVDYVLKSNPRRLVPAVSRALAEAELRRARRAAERRVARLSDVLQMLSEINTAVVRIPSGRRCHVRSRHPHRSSGRLRWLPAGLRSKQCCSDGSCPAQRPAGAVS
jgi:DNA-binding NtrC family response regulator